MSGIKFDGNLYKIGIKMEIIKEEILKEEIVKEKMLKLKSKQMEKVVVKNDNLPNFNIESSEQPLDKEYHILLAGIPSDSRPDLVHRIYQVIDTKELTCTCEHFLFKLQGTGAHCKHIKNYLKMTEEANESLRLESE